MKIQDAITKAIEGGYKNEEAESWSEGNYVDTCYEVWLLDPLFWQALGKSLVWEEKDFRCVNEATFSKHKTCELCLDRKSRLSWRKRNGKGWLYYWHGLVDHLAEGGTIESYFEKL